MAARIHEVKLANGFKALLVERSGLPVVATTLWYRVGSRDERTGQTGLSHFLEHMMFKGTDRYAKGEIDAITTRLGGSNNAFTDNDATAYFFALAADRWEAALEIEANRMQGCLLDPGEFKAEKKVVLEELAMGEDDPWRMLWQAAESLLWQVHPYRHPVIGWKSDLERLDVARMREFYAHHYGPNRAFLVAVGDFDGKRTARRVEELFGGIPRVAEREAVLPEPRVPGERRGTIKAPGTLTRIALAVATCRMGERDDFGLDVLAYVLGTGRNSRLYRRLVVQDEIATEVSVANESRLDPGLLWIAAELRPGANPERAEAAIREEIDAVLHDGITAAELKRARVQTRAAFLFEDETVLDTALKIGRFEALASDGHKLLARVLPTYDELDRREIRDVAARYLDTSAWTAVWSLPEGEALRRPIARRARRAGAKKHGERREPGTSGKQRAAKKSRSAKKPRAARKTPASPPAAKPPEKAPEAPAEQATERKPTRRKKRAGRDPGATS